MYHTCYLSLFPLMSVIIELCISSILLQIFISEVSLTKQKTCTLNSVVNSVEHIASEFGGNGDPPHLYRKDHPHRNQGRHTYDSNKLFVHGKSQLEALSQKHTKHKTMAHAEGFTRKHKRSWSPHRTN